MTRIIERLDEVSAGYDVLFCDLWGCLHNGLRAYPAAVEALRRFRAAGGAVALMSNAPRVATATAAQIKGMGAPRDCYDVIVTSGDATRAAMTSGAMPARVEYVGPDRDLPLFDGAPVSAVPREEAEGVVVTGFRDDSNETPDDYLPAMRDWLARGWTMYCANPDIMVDRGETRAWCGGAIAARYGEMGGAVVQTGKPHRPIYDLGFAEARALTGKEAPRALMIGDGVLTDVQGAANVGIDCLFVTGGLAAADVSDDPERPDPARLDAFLARHGLAPAFAIGRLR